MKEETKNATIRLPQGIADWLTRNGDSINQAVIDAAQALQSIKRVSTSELKGRFAPNEWSLLADSFNGTIVTPDYRYNINLLIAHVEDSVLYDKLDVKWEVDMDSFKRKLSELCGANVDALYDRIEAFWGNEQTDMEEWAKF